MAIKVKAIKVGFFGKYRRVKDVFDIEKESQFSKAWMVKLDIPNLPNKPKAKFKKKPKLSK